MTRRTPTNPNTAVHEAHSVRANRCCMPRVLNVHFSFPSYV